jgi:ribonuclease HI
MDWSKFNRMDSALLQLEHYERTCTDGLEKQLVIMTCRWMQCVGESALDDPIVDGLLKKAQMNIACGWVAPSVPKAPSAPKALWIFCDGACERNGKPGAKAGYGVFVSRPDGSTVETFSAPLAADEPQTNQRAELRALHHALSYALAVPSEERIIIYSDSQYGIDCLTKWAPGWAAAGWRKADKKPVLHTDLIKPCVEMLDLCKGVVSLQHVAAHTGKKDLLSLGNARADQLACEGAAAALTCRN